MLKWLRKYNTYILVVGGCLLMVAFLMQGTLQDLTRRGIIGGKVLRISGQKVTQEQYGEHGREYHALSQLLGHQQILQFVGGGENLDHWIMLTQEAEAGGFVGGPNNGAEFIPTLSRYVAINSLPPQYQGMSQIVDMRASQIEQNITDGLKRAAAESRLTEDQMLKVIAKLNGIMRMRAQYYNSLRFSDRRLVAGVKDLSDGTDVEFVLIPAERELAGIAEPDAAAIQAHYDRFKDTPKGGGDFSIGYKLPPRVKLAWIEINKKAISDAVNPDAVEVQKAFLRKYPTGKPPEGKTEADARKDIENEVKTQTVDKIVRTADEVVRAEVGRTISRLETNGDYRKLPVDWASKRPDFVRIAQDVVARVKEVTGITIPAPTVSVRDTAWLDQAAIVELEGIGRSSLRAGNRTDAFPALVLKARELETKSNDYGLQVGIPFTDTLSDASGNHYYFTLLDARRESSPDSIDEVRDDVVKNIKRLAAYDKLKAAKPAFEQRAITEGLDPIAKAPEGATGEAAIPLTARSATVEKTRTLPPAPDIDSESFRKAVRDLGATLDPLTDVKAIDASKRTLVLPIDKSLSVFVGRIKGLSPMTIDRYRTLQTGMVRQLGSDEMPREEKSDPFTLANMEKRLNVEYLDGRKTSAEREEEASKTAKAE